MSTFYLCSENHSIVGRMDTYLAFHRERDHPRLKTPDHEQTFNRHRTPDNEKTFNPSFNPTFPSAQNPSEEPKRHPNYLNVSPTSPYHPGRNDTSDEALNKIRTANSLTISPELFEKIYLNPQNAVKGDLRQTFGNPTPLALLGFLLSLSPLSCELMGWRGAGGDGIATVGAYYFIGGFLMSLGGILEFFLGNTFSFVVFCSFGGFWFTLGATLTPAFNAYGEYATDPNNIATGLTSPQFHASFGKKPHDLAYLRLMSANNPSSRLLPPLHGSLELHLPRLRPTNQSRLRRHLSWTTTHIRSPHWLVLATSTRQQRHGTEITGCSRCIRVHGDDGWVVDLLCSNACFRGFSLPDSCG